MAALFRSRRISTTLLTNLLHSPPPRSFSTSTNSTANETISKMSNHAPCSLILASSDMKVGSVVHNLHPGTHLSNPSLNLNMDISSQNGSCMPISMMRIGTLIHNIELRPGQGGKLVRAAGTAAKILKEPALGKQCLVRLPSGKEKLVDVECRATIGRVGNVDHGLRELDKAGRSRWLGRRPVVRGVAMNPVDHPHGGGEGKSKSSGSHGGVSRTPWGKPTKSGYKTGPLKRRK